MTYTEIGGAGELRDLLGLPSGRAVTKERTRLHAVDREWLAISPFCVLATSDADGNCDASPKGDPAGHLVHVLDNTTVAIAERPGNKRADGYLNILANPHVGIISLIPGRNETLRINGRARLVRDAGELKAGDLALLRLEGDRRGQETAVELGQHHVHIAAAGDCPILSGRHRLFRSGVLERHRRVVEGTGAGHGGRPVGDHRLGPEPVRNHGQHPRGHPDQGRRPRLEPAAAEHDPDGVLVPPHRPVPV